MQIIDIKDNDAIKIACASLKNGELVIYPTETCYGIAADTMNSDAVTKLLAYKGDRHRQVAIAVSSKEMAQKYVTINEIADNLYTNFLPGPITVISHSKHLVDERLESAEGTLGVRIPDHSFALRLIETYGTPITTTSANTSGKKEPYSYSDWQKYTTREKQNFVSVFLDAGKLLNRPTSTVVDSTLNEPQIVRQGQLTIPALSQTIDTHSELETIDSAQKILSKHLSLLTRYPLIIALQGDLGVGKTQFVKGIANSLGLKNNISSPTYTILKEYPYVTSKYSGILYHLDTWRLNDSNELESTIHLSKLLKPGNIIAIEWASKAKDLLKNYEIDIPILVIDIKEKDQNTRTISYALSTPDWS